MSKTINVKARVGKKLFYNSDSMFGVYSFYLIESSDEIKIDKKWGNFVVSGNCPTLIEGKEYEFIIKPSWSKKYGDGYEFVDIKNRKLNSIEEQQEYLRQVLSNRDAETLIQAYPDVMIVDYIKENKIDIVNLKGIKEKRFNKIKEKLTMYENLQVALVELKDLGISMNALQRLVNHFGTQDSLIENIKKNIYILTEVDLFGFIKVDEYAMNRGDDPTSSHRIKACFEHIVKENGKDGHSWILIDNLISKAEEMLKIKTKNITDVINQLKDNPEKFYFNKDKFTLRNYYRYEYIIKKHLDRLISTYKTPEQTKDISDVEKEFGFTFTDEQKKSIKIAQNSGVFILNGKAGSGKTTILKGIIDSLQNDNYMTCALSGKAAKVLNSKGIKAMTIHRMLGVDGTGYFTYNERNKLPYDIVVLDEASMVNSHLFSSIVQALQDGCKFIIVGDNAQLPPIGLAAVFDDLLSTNKYPNKELTQIHRQAQDSGILSVANTIREGKKINGRYEYNQQAYGANKDMVLFPFANREDIFPTIIEIAKEYVRKFGKDVHYNFQIITALKQRGENSVKNLNKELQGIFNDLDKAYLERNGYQFREDDKVIQSGNNYNAYIYPDIETYMKMKHFEIEEVLDHEDFKHEVEISSVFNGTVGKIIHINFDKKEVLIQFEDIEGLILYTQQELSMIELAYAITVHRSQGMGIKNVLVTFDYVAYKLLSKQMVYTALTRASEKLVVVCENSALHKAIETDLGSTRNTFLRDLIMNEG